jgi:hypothetical protein
MRRVDGRVDNGWVVQVVLALLNYQDGEVGIRLGKPASNDACCRPSACQNHIVLPVFFKGAHDAESADTKVLMKGGEFE